MACSPAGPRGLYLPHGAARWLPHGGFLKPDTVSYELVALAHFRAGLASKGLIIN